MAGPATDQTVEWWKGDTGTLRIPVLTAAGAAINLSGASARWWLARSASTPSANVWVKKGVGTGLTITVETVNSVPNVYVLNIALSSANTDSLPTGSWYHEAEVIDASGDIVTVLTGSFVLRNTVVR